MTQFRFLILLMLCSAAPTTGWAQFVQTSVNLPTGTDETAIAYDQSGTLFVLGSQPNNVLAIDSDGVQRTINITTPGVNIASVGDAVIDPTNDNRLLITEGAFGAAVGSVIAIDTNTGDAEVLFSGSQLANIQRIAVRDTGEIFVSTSINPFAAATPPGSVFQVNTSGPAATATQVVGGLDAGAGLQFDAAGNLVFQNANDGTADGTGDFSAEIRRLGVTETALGLQFDATSELLIASTTGEFDFVFDSEGDIFTVGTLGLFEHAQDSSGTFDPDGTQLVGLGAATPIFSGPVAFLPGSLDFDSNLTINPGETSPLLTFIPDLFSPPADNQLITLSLRVSAVPEPASAVLLVIPTVLYGLRRKRHPVRKIGQ